MCSWMALGRKYAKNILYGLLQKGGQSSAGCSFSLSNWTAPSAVGRSQTRHSPRNCKAVEHPLGAKTAIIYHAKRRPPEKGVSLDS
ncbi:Hypothetical predicted protein [Cloeon dipterum]|uniref:Uncharacterized protein n=1 Tax=Cloeon dipterum TaxID=197152 RepID=A0A8S1E1I0_9INSE|nr:Hypothetical predicted protein [Cloeon dipterum]